MPGFPIFWAWSVGCANRSIELAVYAFFQTDQGKAILNVADGVEFKFGIALLVLPPSSQAPGYCPTGFTAATFPLQEDHEAVIIPPTSSSLPRSHVCIRAMTGGWLQTAPHTDLKPHLLVKPRDPQANADQRYMGGWVVDANGSAVYGWVTAIVGNRGYLVSALDQMEG
ncbi:hypothetical protein VTJ04DRAFT_7612 [Mycothermus thermophilus]|uniref:uncharacterized protein n=1 Tax=Humicola insolens TaxID=85995 RepID=UPI003742308A